MSRLTPGHSRSTSVMPNWPLMGRVWGDPLTGWLWSVVEPIRSGRSSTPYGWSHEEVCLVGRTGSLKTPERPDEPDRRGTNGDSRMTYRERLSHISNWDLAPCAGWEIFQFEGTVLNAPEPSHFMPQRLKQSADFAVLPLDQNYFQM